MNKITALLERLERVKLAHEMEPEPDALSISLWELGGELAALDDGEVADLAEGWGIDPDDVREMARTYAR